MSNTGDPLAGLSPDQRRALLRELLAKKAAAEALPSIRSNPGDRHLPFPLTELQVAYLIGGGEGIALGGTDCHAWFEFEARDLDLERLESAWIGVVGRHEMLRAVVCEDGRSQRILERTPRWTLPVEDLRRLSPPQVEARLEARRATLQTRRYDPRQWPLFDLGVALLPDGAQRVFVDFNLLMLDAASVLASMVEWRVLYRGEPLPSAPGLSFRDYVLARAEADQGPALAAARQHWAARLPTLPPAPELGGRRGTPRTHRRSAVLEADRWARLRSRAFEVGLTPSGLLAAAMVQVLGRYSASPQFTLTLTLFDRPPLHPEVRALAGEFTSTLLLACDGSDGPFLARATALAERLRADLAHVAYSGVRVQRDLSQLRGGPVLFPVVFTSTLGAASDEGALEWLGPMVAAGSQTPQVALDFQIFQVGGRLLYSWDVVDDALEPGLPDAMFASYRALLERLVEADWSQPPGALLPEDQRLARLEFNQSGAPCAPGLLHGPFLETARQHPEYTAVIAADRRLSYGGLLALSDTLLATLQRHGVAPGERVAVHLEKGWRQAVAVLAVLRAGGAWLPIEVDLPAARVAALLEGGGARLCLTDQPVPLGVLAIPVPEAPDGTRGVDVPTAPSALAYVIYTSGSTGAPKGVMISHEAALNTILDINRRFEVGPRDRVLGLSALGFDLSVYDLFGLWAAGGAVVFPAPGSGRDPAAWSELLAREGVTLWNTVPALLEMLVVYGGLAAARDLRLCLLSGDWIPVTLPERARSQRPGLRMISLGGATEASIWSVYYDIETVDPTWPSVPYGRPLRGQTLHVLDGDLNPRPVGVAGDLYIGGAGLALGYLGAPELSAERFFAHPLTGERLYRTGDRARFRPDGAIEFLGRLDGQVKIGGHRVELGEIEAALARHPALRAVAVAAPVAPGGGRRLVAYVVAASEQADLFPTLEAWLSELLPAYMVPRVWVRLEALPLSGNGKVDRARLPSPEPAAPASAEARPRTPTEAALLELVRELLHAEQIPVGGNLFELGATSLTIVALHRRIAATLAPELSLVDLYAWPSVRSLAAHIDASSAGDADREEAARRGAERRARRGARIQRGRATTDIDNED